MADRDNTSKARPGRNPAAAKAQSASSLPKPAKAVPTLEHLENIVEDERARLMKAHSILSCVVMAMEEEQLCTGDGPYWPSVIESARDLVDESIRRLDSLDYSGKRQARPPNEVREPALTYGYSSWAGSGFLSTSDNDDGWEEGACSLEAWRAIESADVAAALEPSMTKRKLN